MLRQQIAQSWRSVPLRGIPTTTIVALAVFAAFAVIIRAPFFDVPMISDEGSYAYVAHFWTDEYQLYRDIPFDRPQGIFLVYDLILSVIGSDVESLRMGAAIYNVGTALALWLVAQRLFDAEAAWLSALLFAIVSVSPSIEGFTANAELFASLPLTLAALMTWRGRWGWAGVFSGLAFLLKPIGLSGLILALGWVVLMRASWRGGLRAIAAFSLSPLLMLGHGYLIGWNYFWHAVVERKLTADTVVAHDFLTQGMNFIDSLAITAPAWLVLVALTAVAYPTWTARTRAFVWLWVVSSLLGMAVGGHWSRHYYVQLVPALALMAAPGACRLLRSPRRPFSHWVVLGALVVFGAVELPLWFSPPDVVSERIYARPAYVLNDEIAAYVSQHTTEDETIYVAFYQSEIYYLARRRNAVPQMFRYELAYPNVYGQIVSSISRREPAMVVWVQPPPVEYATPEQFEAVLAQGYVEVQRFAAGDQPAIRVFARIPTAPNPSRH
jgi:4-amino-4-deoxy-L-arabinose transferase-like glycosyltransferase